jgi:hypothetical protein
MKENKIDWFCPKCNSYVSSENVTFEETHQICNTAVILKDLNKTMKTAVEYLHSEYKRILGSVLVTPQQIIEMSDALENAKEIEKEQISYTEFEVLQLLLKFHQTKSFHNLYDWFQKNKKQQEQ